MMKVTAVMLSYPDSPLGDGVVWLRPWREDDLECLREAAGDPAIPAITQIPAAFTDVGGLAWVEPGNEASLRVLAAAGFHGRVFCAPST